MTWLSAVRSWPLVVDKVFLVVDGMNFWPWKEWIECPGWLNSLFILLGVTKVDQKNSFIAGPKIQARRHCLTNQIRIFIVLEPRNFLLISFWFGFSRMFLFYVFSWLVEKYKNVTLMLMRFSSEISRMFLCMFLWLIILRLKKTCILYMPLG